MRLTIEELKDYIVNNDFEIQIIKMDCKAVARALEFEGVRANHADILKAMLDLQHDPYMRQFKHGRAEV